MVDPNDPAPFGETPRLLLREFVPDDWEAVLTYAADPDVLRYRLEPPATPNEVRAGLARIAGQRDAHPRTRFEMAIVRKDTGQLIGWLPLFVGAGGREAEMGWTLVRAQWGNGFAAEAAHFALGFAFNTLGLHRVWARCVTENTASRRVMEKIRMRREAHRKKSEWLHGECVDTFVYAILREEYVPVTPA